MPASAELTSSEPVASAERRLAAIEALGERWRTAPKRNDRINQHIRSVLGTAGITRGDVLEIGAREHPRINVFTTPTWTYSVLDIEDCTTDVPVIVGNVTSCPELADESFDVIVNVDVMEHVDRPWLAASEIERLLRPGGLSYTSTLFAWRYHPVPIDFWRFTPECLRFLFSGLDCIQAEFDTTERRRDIRGRGRRDQVAVDELGGFRENWRVVHVGRKP
jgi:SAM-dependent methyltransferase